MASRLYFHHAESGAPVDGPAAPADTGWGPQIPDWGPFKGNTAEYAALRTMTRLPGSSGTWVSKSWLGATGPQCHGLARFAFGPLAAGGVIDGTQGFSLRLGMGQDLSLGEQFHLMLRVFLYRPSTGEQFNILHREPATPELEAYWALHYPLLAQTDEEAPVGGPDFFQYRADGSAVVEWVGRSDFTLASSTPHALVDGWSYVYWGDQFGYYFKKHSATAQAGDYLIVSLGADKNQHIDVPQEMGIGYGGSSASDPMNAASYIEFNASSLRLLVEPTVSFPGLGQVKLSGSRPSGSTITVRGR